MKKILLLILTLALTLNLAACGGDEAVTLVSVDTTKGFSIKLPSDMTLQSNGSYTNTSASDVVTFDVATADPASPLTDYSKEDFIANELAGRTDLAVSSYDNKATINGKPALICKFSFKMDSGTVLNAALVLVDDGTKSYIVSYLYDSKNATGSLATNLDVCIAGIKAA